MAHRPAMERVCSISCEQMHTRRTGENVCGACDDTSQARCSYRLPCAEDNATEDRAAAARLLRAADLHGPGLRFRGSPAQTDSWERSTAALVPGKAERVASGVARSRRVAGPLFLPWRLSCAPSPGSLSSSPGHSPPCSASSWGVAGEKKAWPTSRRPRPSQPQLPGQAGWPSSERGQ